MGIVDLPKLHDYWSSDGITQIPWFRGIMTYDRFFQIPSNLRLSDNTQNDYDKLAKLGSMTKIFNQLFSLRYHPKREVSIDE